LINDLITEYLTERPQDDLGSRDDISMTLSNTIQRNRSGMPSYMSRREDYNPPDSAINSIIDEEPSGNLSNRSSDREDRRSDFHRRSKPPKTLARDYSSIGSDPYHSSTRKDTSKFNSIDDAGTASYELSGLSLSRDTETYSFSVPKLDSESMVRPSRKKNSYKYKGHKLSDLNPIKESSESFEGIISVDSRTQSIEKIYSDLDKLIKRKEFLGSYGAGDLELTESKKTPMSSFIDESVQAPSTKSNYFREIIEDRLSTGEFQATKSDLAKKILGPALYGVVDRQNASWNFGDAPQKPRPKRKKDIRSRSSENLFYKSTYDRQKGPPNVLGSDVP
jgi:hypothetical protein